MTKQMYLCLCGCGKLTAKTYAPGHDQVVVWRVIREHYGDTESFLNAHEWRLKQGLPSPEGS